MNKKNDIFFDKDSFFFYVSILNISNEQKDQVYKMRELERGRETIHTYRRLTSKEYLHVWTDLTFVLKKYLHIWCEILGVFKGRKVERPYIRPYHESMSIKYKYDTKKKNIYEFCKTVRITSVGLSYGPRHAKRARTT